MFKTINVKLYRRFFILAILLGGLSMVSFSNASNAAMLPCCNSCEDTQTACLTVCNNGQIKDWMIPACEDECNTHYDNCSHHCNMSCP
jgi:hypothetical protein